MRTRFDGQRGIWPVPDRQHLDQLACRFATGWKALIVGSSAFAVVAVLSMSIGGSAAGEPTRGHSLAGCSQNTGFFPNSSERKATLVDRDAIRLVLCRYSHFTPEGRRVVTKRWLIHAIISHLNLLPQLPHRRWVSCPASDDTVVAVMLHYRALPTLTVLIQTDGCRWVKAAKQRRWALGRRGAQLMLRVLALTDCRLRPRFQYGCR
jgi:hypothetical protein